MDVRELQKLNKEKNRILVVIIIIAFIGIMGFYFNIWTKINGRIIPILLIIAIIIPSAMYSSVMNKIKKLLIPYVLSVCPSWKLLNPKDEIINFYKDDIWDTKLLPSKQIMFGTILPTYNQNKVSLLEVFSYDNKNLNRTITQMEYIKPKSYRESRNDINFYATILTVKNSKRLQSTTVFKTNNYPKGTEKYIIQEKSELELPKIELADAYKYNIDAYSDDPNIATNLATSDLFSTMQNIKQQFNSRYVKVIFSGNYIVFVLRNEESGLLEHSTFSIKIPYFKSIDYPLLEKAVNNFKTLTDLANQAPEFTKNI